MWAVSLEAGIQSLSCAGRTKSRFWTQKTWITEKSLLVLCQSTAGFLSPAPLRFTAQWASLVKRWRRQECAWKTLLNLVNRVKRMKCMCATGAFSLKTNKHTRFLAFYSGSSAAGWVAFTLAMLVLAVLGVLYFIKRSKYLILYKCLLYVFLKRKINYIKQMNKILKQMWITTVYHMQFQ